MVGDITGFAAACYQRGVAFLQVPTTLLAQVDSSIGGKTGVNHPLGKNMIGAFHQPQCVIADTETLNTLDDRQLRAGIAEIIKYGLIRDPRFFEWLEVNVEALLARDPQALAYAIERSCQNKKQRWWPPTNAKAASAHCSTWATPSDMPLRRASATGNGCTERPSRPECISRAICPGRWAGCPGRP